MSMPDPDDRKVASDIMQAEDHDYEVVKKDAYGRPLVVEHFSPTVQVGNRYRIEYAYSGNEYSSILESAVRGK